MSAHRDDRPARSVAGSLAMAALLAVATVAGPSSAWANQQPSPGNPAPAAQRRPTATPAAELSLLQRLRELIGYNPRQAVGGSRSNGAAGVCLVTPRFHQGADERSMAMVSIPSPTLLAAEPLNEVRLENGGRILWSQRASSTTPITGPIPWPLPPLKPGETVTLRLRPRGAAGAEFADIQLQAASAAEQQRAVTLLADPRPRLELVEGQALVGRSALASELLFAPMEPTPGSIATLRRQIIEQGCARNRHSP